MRTTLSGCGWLLLVGLQFACSSKSDGGSTSMGGSGTILGAGGNASGGSAGSRNTAGSGGTGTAGPGAGSGGTAAADCANAPIVCLDAMTASTCNPATGKDETFDCASESMDLGFTSNGCLTDAANGDHCTIDELNDAECAAGYAPWGVCQGYGPESALDIYIACFLDEQMLHAPIACYAKYYDEATEMLDCVGAAAECDAL